MGSRAPTRWRHSATRDHPRACREQPIENPTESRMKGSSPRVRGAGLRPGRDRPLRGIIPACAGSSSRPSRRAQAGRDHPRVCGEQCSPFFARYVRPGSSPRMRGAADAQLVVDELVGIIPACAGSSSRSRPRGTGSWDHPRVCGEQLRSCVHLSFRVGSSPRMRGTGEQGTRGDDLAGIIPAHAGNSSSSR